MSSRVSELTHAGGGAPQLHGDRTPVLETLSDLALGPAIWLPSLSLVINR